ncbi:MAG TPA: hypothetical protein VN700_10870 [Vicinamibacterales bacterium]|nr:hypothetical protein [Vicinamibacterales bacterium]
MNTIVRVAATVGFATIAIGGSALAKKASSQTQAPPFITASPNPVPRADGLGATTITWDAGNEPDARVFVSTDGAAPNLFAAGSRGSEIAPWIAGGSTYEFRLHRGDPAGPPLAAIRVTRVPDPSPLELMPRPAVLKPFAVSWALALVVAGVCWIVRRRLRRLAETPLPIVVVCVFAAIAPSVLWDRGVLDGEAVYFVTQYSADRPFFPKIFDPHLNDFDAYQARELSYVVDWADARVYGSLTRRIDPGYFVPASGIVLTLGLLLVFVRGARRTFANTDRLTLALLLGLFATTFVVMTTMGIFYRSGKAGLMVVLAAFLFHLREVARRRADQSGRPPGLVTTDSLFAFLMTVAAGMLDRQGLFYAVMAMALLAVHFAMTRRLLDFIIALAAAVAVLQAYNLWLAPWIIHALNGYWPDFYYQHIPAEDLAKLPQLSVAAARLLAENAWALAGGFWPMSASALVAVLALAIRERVFARPDGVASPGSRRVLAYAALLALGHIAMFAIMIARHHYVNDWPDHRYWYFPLTYLVVVLFGLAVGLNWLLGRLSAGGRRIVQVVLLALVIGNLTSLEYYRRVMLGGPWFGPSHAQSLLLESSLRKGEAEPGLDDKRRIFLEFWNGR